MLLQMNGNDEEIVSLNRCRGRAPQRRRRRRSWTQPHTQVNSCSTESEFTLHPLDGEVKVVTIYKKGKTRKSERDVWARQSERDVWARQSERDVWARQSERDVWARQKKKGRMSPLKWKGRMSPLMWKGRTNPFTWHEWLSVVRSKGRRSPFVSA